jgi:hypothetical protein
VAQHRIDMLARLRRVLPAGTLPEGTTFARSYAGTRQRADGAWSWFAVGPDGSDLCLGSHWPMHALLGMEWLTVTREQSGDLVVDPLTKPVNALQASRLVAVA